MNGRRLLITQARFVCPGCAGRAVCEIVVPEPSWGASDKMSELGSSDDTELTCNHCGQAFDGFVRNEAAGCFVNLVDHPAVEVAADYAFSAAPDGDSLWVDWDVPGDPFAVFMDSYYTSGVILGDHNLPVGDDLINRMIFAQQVGALEAYLGDTLVRAVLSDPSAIGRLITQDRDLAETRFSLVQFAARPDLVRETVKLHLKGVIYHNLAKVDVLYKIALGVPVLGAKDENDVLFRAVQLRHDCVHRNGFSPDGERLTVFTQAFVGETIDSLRAVVERVERAVRGRPRLDENAS